MDLFFSPEKLSQFRIDHPASEFPQLFNDSPINEDSIKKDGEPLEYNPTEHTDSVSWDEKPSRPDPHTGKEAASVLGSITGTLGSTFNSTHCVTKDNRTTGIDTEDDDEGREGKGPRNEKVGHEDKNGLETMQNIYDQVNNDKRQHIVESGDNDNKERLARLKKLVLGKKDKYQYKDKNEKLLGFVNGVGKETIGKKEKQEEIIGNFKTDLEKYEKGGLVPDEVKNIVALLTDPEFGSQIYEDAEYYYYCEIIRESQRLGINLKDAKEYESVDWYYKDYKGTLARREKGKKAEENPQPRGPEEMQVNKALMDLALSLFPRPDDLKGKMPKRRNAWYLVWILESNQRIEFKLYFLLPESITLFPPRFEKAQKELRKLLKNNNIEFLENYPLYFNFHYELKELELPPNEFEQAQQELKKLLEDRGIEFMEDNHTYFGSQYESMGPELLPDDFGQAQQELRNNLGNNNIELMKDDHGCFDFNFGFTELELTPEEFKQIHQQELREQPRGLSIDNFIDDFESRNNHELPLFNFEQVQQALRPSDESGEYPRKKFRK